MAISNIINYCNFGVWFIDLFIVGVLLKNQNLEKINLIIDDIKS